MHAPSWKHAGAMAPRPNKNCTSSATQKLVEANGPSFYTGGLAEGEVGSEDAETNASIQPVLYASQAMLMLFILAAPGPLYDPGVPGEAAMPAIGPP
mmetsp:Transcript_27005/g.48825  ORF Transcript_27005/g.48825 Transcript_27005/m.48825 type:complete len:97 (+) Transcript_27005:74-364(+)